MCQTWRHTVFLDTILVHSTSGTHIDIFKDSRKTLRKVYFFTTLLVQEHNWHTFNTAVIDQR